MNPKFLAILISIALVACATIFIFLNNQKISKKNNSPKNQNIVKEENSETPKVIAGNLDTPWAIAFLPDKSILVTERPGRVRLIDKEGNLHEKPVGILEKAQEIGEGGLMGIALHPDFPSNRLVYLYYTFLGSGGNTLNRVARMEYKDNLFLNEQTIVDNIPGAQNHNGGRIKFGPDKFLYITTGDAQNPSMAQDKKSLAGKILRVTEEGQPAPGNPFNNLIYSYGHRNPQGLAWKGQALELWATEHGPSGAQSGNDEINKIEAGKNYGWPIIQGDQTQSGMEVPIKHSGTTSTWAPAGATFIENALYFVGLRGQTLYQAKIENGQIVSFKEHFKGQYGRLREAIAGPDGMLYLTTSNRDGRGIPALDDDKIIKIDPMKLK